MRERGVTQRGEATSLVWGDLKGENGRDKVGITTTLHRDEELWLVAAARAAGADRTAALTPAQIAAAVRRFPDLDFTSGHGKAQRAVMEQLGTGGRLTVAIGVAGSGKSTLLKPLVDAWKEDGRQVHGIALAWRQSDDLTDAGITARNARAVESFLKSVEKGRIRLGARSVVVVDELGLLGTRQLNDLLRAQKEHGFQIVGIGDPKQMQSVEAGAVVDLLRRGLGETAIPTLETSVRQVEKEERETTLMFRNGETAAAVQRKVGERHPAGDAGRLRRCRAERRGSLAAAPRRQRRPGPVCHLDQRADQFRRPPAQHGDPEPAARPRRGRRRPDHRAGDEQGRRRCQDIRPAAGRGRPGAPVRAHQRPLPRHQQGRQHRPQRHRPGGCRDQ